MAAYVSISRTGSRHLHPAGAYRRARSFPAAGVNSTRFFADGNALALTLSGAAAIWISGIARPGHTAAPRLTTIRRGYRADLEPRWQEHLLYFRSRGGRRSKDRYRQSRRVQRVSFGSATWRVRVCLRTDQDRVREREAATIGSPCRTCIGHVSVLSRGSLDESPSFAPNGATIIYAGGMVPSVRCSRFSGWAGVAASDLEPGRAARAGVGAVPTLRCRGVVIRRLPR